LAIIEAAFTQSEDAINFTDEKGVLIRVNEAYLQLYKFSIESEVLGKTQSVIRSPETPDLVYKEIWETISQGQTWKGEMNNRAKDGSDVHIHLTITPIQKDGKIIGYMGVSQDRIPQAQRDWQHYHARKQAIVGILGMGLAHQLNNPLAALLLDAEFIEETLTDTVVSESRRHHALTAAESIIRGVDMVSKVLNHYLEFSTQDIPESNMTFALNELLDDCLMLFEGQLHSTGIEVVLNPTHDLWVQGNRSQLESVLFQLLSNTQKAFDGSGRASKHISISTKVDESTGRILIEYSDNSGGLPHNNPESIFDPLYSIQCGDKSCHGLALSRKILREHGGEITCNSGNGEVRYRIWLPLAPPELRMRPPMVRMGKMKEELKIKVLRPIPPRISRRELGYTNPRRTRKQDSQKKKKAD